jgi:choline dehydrogenase-like flavoprotein
VLKDAGVEVVHDLPGVGRNLQDHLEVYFQFRCKQPITLNGHLTPWGKFLIGAALGAVQVRPGRDQPFRELRLHPQSRRPRMAGHPVPLPAWRHAL